MKLFTMKAQASRSVLDDPLQRYKFRVTLAGMPSGAGFSKVSGFKDEIDVIEYCEGMWTNIHKIPGRDRNDPLTLERGMYADKDAENQLNKVRTNPNMRSTTLLDIANKYGQIKRSYQLAESWVSAIEFSEWDAVSGDIAIETMTLQYEYVIGSGGNAFGVIGS